MKRRIMTAAAAVLCALMVFSAGLAPAHAYAPPSGEGDAVVQSEEVRVYYRLNDGVYEMRIWSLTRQVWMTDWVPVPEGWNMPDFG